MYIAILHIRECSLIEAYPNYAHSESKANVLVEAIIDVHVHYRFPSRCLIKFVRWEYYTAQ